MSPPSSRRGKNESGASDVKGNPDRDVRRILEAECFPQFCACSPVRGAHSTEARACMRECLLDSPCLHSHTSGCFLPYCIRSLGTEMELLGHGTGKG